MFPKSHIGYGKTAKQENKQKKTPTLFIIKILIMNFFLLLFHSAGSGFSLGITAQHPLILALHGPNRHLIRQKSKDGNFSIYNLCPYLQYL